MFKTSWKILGALVCSALLIGGFSACSKGGPGTSASVVTYEVTAQGEGKVRVSYLKKVPPKDTPVSATEASDYVAVEVVPLPWKKQVTLDGGSDNSFLTAAFDPSSVEIGAGGVKLPGLNSIQYSCSISALGKQIDQKQGSGTLTCEGPDARSRVQGLQ